MEANNEDSDLELIKAVNDQYSTRRNFRYLNWTNIGAKINKSTSFCMQRWVELRELYANFFRHTPDGKLTPILKALQSLFQEQQSYWICGKNFESNMADEEIDHKLSLSTAKVVIKRLDLNAVKANNDDEEDNLANLHSPSNDDESGDDTGPSYSDVSKPIDEFIIETDENEISSNANDATDPIALDSLEYTEKDNLKTKETQLLSLMDIPQPIILNAFELEDDTSPSYSDVPKPFDESVIKIEDEESSSNANDVPDPIDLAAPEEIEKEKLKTEEAQLDIDIKEEGIIGDDGNIIDYNLEPSTSSNGTTVEKKSAGNKKKNLQNNILLMQKLNKIRQENKRLKQRLNKIDKSSVYLFYESIADTVLTFPERDQAKIRLSILDVIRKAENKNSDSDPATK